MKRDDRQKAIMDLLIAEGEVDLDALCDRYSVSRMTAHRDLDDLEAAGFLRKIRGGATIVQVREKGLESRAFAELARRCVAAAEGSGVPVLINDRVDIALASGAAPRPIRCSAPALRPLGHRPRHPTP